jgi:DNA-binding MarR family transcriptional regulator
MARARTDETPAVERWERDPRLEDLYRRPGFMLRRAHQIAVGIFADECAEHDLTTIQHGVLVALATFPGLHQISLGRLLGLDRTTIGSVVRRLEERGLVRRAVGADKRRRTLRLTRRGERMRAASAGDAARAQDRLLERFSPDERTTLLALLSLLVDGHNAETRVPHGPPAA